MKGYLMARSPVDQSLSSVRRFHKEGAQLLPTECYDRRLFLPMRTLERLFEG